MFKCNFGLHSRAAIWHAVAAMEDKARLYPGPGRRAPAQGVHISLGQPTIVFLTVCAKNRRPWIAQPAVQTTLASVWREATAWLTGYYLLMPDHLHLFCAPNDLRFTIGQWTDYWKSQFRRRHLDQPWHWQRNAFHHRLRDPRQYHEKWAYNRENPVRASLVSHVDDWPHWGMIHELRW